MLHGCQLLFGGLHPILRVEMGTVDRYYPIFSQVVIICFVIIIFLHLDDKFACPPPCLINCLNQRVKSAELGDFFTVGNDDNVGLSHCTDRRISNPQMRTLAMTLSQLPRLPNPPKNPSHHHTQFTPRFTNITHLLSRIRIILRLKPTTTCTLLFILLGLIIGKMHLGLPLNLLPQFLIPIIGSFIRFIESFGYPPFGVG
mmetsp:Transcript_19981/g.31186  ORF Transcript_19981/g.31186 Transcript_19981/m.31186 type:complete len:200 (-) Transcript_19981:334-933(-)